MSAAPPEQRLRHTIDVGRGIAIIGVVAIHFGGSFVTPENAWTPSFELGLFVNQVFSFGVPLFVFMAGMLGRRSCDRPDFSYGRFYRQRLQRLLPAYLAASLASFWLLNHLPEWNALPSLGQRAVWLIQKLFVYGIEPTLYFVPLLLQLTALQPFLVRLPRWLSARGPSAAAASWFSPDRIALYCSAALLALHLAVAHLCYHGTLNYYVWGRPSPALWLFLFFVGLHRDSLIRQIPRRTLVPLLGLAIVGATGAMALNWHHLHDRLAVGAMFEHSGVDYAYVRPIIVIFNLAAVSAVALWIEIGAPLRQPLLELCGRCTYAIYLWHILFLYYIAWARPDVLHSCRRIPEMIVILALFASLAIATASDARRIFSRRTTATEP